MGSPVRTYQKEMHDNLGMMATWLPADPLEVGDVGVFEGGRFRRATTLAELGIACDREEAGSRTNLQFTSRHGVKVQSSAGAAVPGAGSMQVSVEFSSQGAFLFHATDVQMRRLTNRPVTAAAVLELYRRKRWDKAWLIVESVHAAKQATVLVAEDEAAALSLVAQSKIALPSLSLADPKVELQVTATQGKLFQVLGAKNLQPLYACLRIRDPLFGAAELAPVRGAADAAALIERPSIAELLDS